MTPPVKLTSLNGTPIWVFPEHVIAVASEPWCGIMQTTVFTQHTAWHIPVQESVEDVVARLTGTTP